MTLREVFHRAKSRTLPDQWLYLPSDAEWTLDSDATFLDWELEEKDPKEVRLVAKKRNLQATLNQHMIENVVVWADRLSGGEDDEARLEVFLYYHKFDGVPD